MICVLTNPFYKYIFLPFLLTKCVNKDVLIITIKHLDISFSGLHTVCVYVCVGVDVCVCIHHIYPLIILLIFFI